MRRAFLLLVALLAVPASAAERIELVNGRLFLPVEVNGTAAPGLLDSAAEVTALDDDLAARLGLLLHGGEEVSGTGGKAPVRFSHGVTLAAAGVRIGGATVAVLDFADVVNRLIRRPTEVILGREFFDSGRFRIDIARGELSAVARDKDPKGKRFALATRKGVEAFPAAVEGQPLVWAEFDLGNGSEVLVGRAYADRIGLTQKKRIVGRRAGGGIGGAVQRDMVVLKKLKVGGKTYRDVPAAIDDLPNAADLNIGTSILKDFVITTDFPQHLLWLEQRR